MAEYRENNHSEPWWVELEEIEQASVRLNWCCRLILEGGFEQFIQEEIGIYVSLRFGVNYCPHCGRPLKADIRTDLSGACCRLFTGLALEGIVFEEPSVDEHGRVEYSVHRLFANYCFNCGRPLKGQKHPSRPHRCIGH